MPSSATISPCRPMKIYNEQFALQSQKQREVFNITTQVKAAAEKSRLREGIVVVSSLHSSTAIIVTQDEPGLLDDLFEWLDEVSPASDGFRHEGRFENAAHVRFQSLLLSHQAIVPFTEGRLDLGPEQALLFVELDGLRPRRIVVKIVGE
ncbi:MAG: secondary thiamine-phosphate synthase enzyme YjbQ [Candidatus Acidiferrales bacterium]